MGLRPARKFVVILLAILVIAGAGLGYFFVQLTARPVIELAQEPNAVETRSALHKVKLFQEAQEGKRRGYIQLSEVEINSYLDETFFSKNHETNGIVLVNGRLLLNDRGFTWVSWIDASLFGLQLPLVWQRHFDLVKEEEAWKLALRGMQVGQMQMHEDQWETVLGYLDHFEGLYQETFGWVLKAPVAEIAKNELSKAPELRLYTFVPDKTETK